MRLAPICAFLLFYSLLGWGNLILWSIRTEPLALIAGLWSFASALYVAVKWTRSTPPNLHL